MSEHIQQSIDELVTEIEASDLDHAQVYVGALEEVAQLIEMDANDNLGSQEQIVNTLFENANTNE